MITKKSMLNIICDLAAELDDIHVQIDMLENKVNKIKTATQKPKKTK